MSEPLRELHLVGAPGSARVLERSSLYAAKIRKVARIDVEDSEAEELWQAVARHRRSLLNRLGRDVGQRVALLDYVVNIQPASAGEVHLIDKSELARVEQLAVTDALTGLQNRHSFDLELEREIRRSHSLGTSASLLLLDLDGFKSINDRYGHCAGDEVLRQVGVNILEHVRGADIACRFGGDEFAVILPDTSLETAIPVSERMCTEINAWFGQNAVLGCHVQVTATGGLAMLGDGDSAAELLDNADKALYGAKRAGGARVRPSLVPERESRLEGLQ